MPRDVFILGCGRSGTSMVAGLLRSAGYFHGASLHEARPSNPLGFFEDAEVNDINEAILGSAAHDAGAPGPGQKWLARVPLDRPIDSTPVQDARIREILSVRPFCLKDPRFCYTLAFWRRQAPQARMVCVFRQPQVVVASILKEISVMPYLQGLELTIGQAYEVWRLMYTHVLERHALTGEWLFVEYMDLFVPATLDRIEAFLETGIDRRFPTPALNRSQPVDVVDSPAMAIYEKLLARSKATLWQ